MEEVVIEGVSDIKYSPDELQLIVAGTETITLARAFVKLVQDAKQLDALLATNKKQQAEIETELLRRFEKDNVQRMVVDGRTVYMHRQWWANSAGDRDATVAALKSCGMEALISETFNSTQLSAVMREKKRQFEEGEGKPLSPDEVLARLDPRLQSTINLTEKFSLRTKGD